MDALLLAALGAVVALFLFLNRNWELRRKKAEPAAPPPAPSEEDLAVVQDLHDKEVQVAVEEHQKTVETLVKELRRESSPVPDAQAVLPFLEEVSEEVRSDTEASSDRPTIH